MNAKKTLIAFFCFFSLFVPACELSRDEKNDIMKANQKQASGIIEAIAIYEQDYGQLPERLDVLVPKYLSEIPKTTMGQDFDYSLNDLDGYYLCFYSARTENWGCCYYHRLERWDCSYGYGE